MKKLVLLAVVALLALGTVVPAFADEGVVNATIEVAGGSLSVAPLNITFEGVTLEGKSASSDGTTGVWEANDPTGTGAGWKVEIKATDFVSGEHNIPVDGFKAYLDGDTIAPADPSVTSTEPTSAMEAGVALSGDYQKMLSAAEGEGMGHYEFQPNFDLFIPADTYAGSYTSTVTVQITAAP